MYIYRTIDSYGHSHFYMICSLYISNTRPSHRFELLSILVVIEIGHLRTGWYGTFHETHIQKSHLLFSNGKAEPRLSPVRPSLRTSRKRRSSAHKRFLEKAGCCCCCFVCYKKEYFKFTMSDDWIMKICCMGAGYVGGPTMAVIAKQCPKVNNFWVDPRRDIVPIVEMTVEEMVLNGKLAMKIMANHTFLYTNRYKRSSRERR